MPILTIMEKIIIDGPGKRYFSTRESFIKRWIMDNQKSINKAAAIGAGIIFFITGGIILTDMIKVETTDSTHKASTVKAKSTPIINKITVKRESKRVNKTAVIKDLPKRAVAKKQVAVKAVHKTINQKKIITQIKPKYLVQVATFSSNSVFMFSGRRTYTISIGASSKKAAISIKHKNKGSFIKKA